MRKLAGPAWRKRDVFTRPVCGVARTRWAAFLEELELSEEDVLAWLAAGVEQCVTRRRITIWVRTHCRHWYVPEPVLKALRIDLDEIESALRPGNYYRSQYAASREGHCL